MRAKARELRVALGRRVRKLKNQNIIGMLVGLAVPPLPRVLRIGRLRQLLQHVLAAFRDVARRSVLDGQEVLGVGGAAVCDGEGVAFDGFDGPPDGVGCVALGFGVVVFGVESGLRGGFDVGSAVARCALQPADGVVAVGVACGLQTCVCSSID